MSIVNVWRMRNSSHPPWVGEQAEAAFVDLNSGQVIGRYLHDGYNKSHIDFRLPCGRAWRPHRSGAAWFTDFDAFSRCWVSLFRAKSVEAARDAVEQFAGKVIFERDDPGE